MILTAIGAGMVASSAFGMFLTSPSMTIRRHMAAYFRAVKLADVQIGSIVKKPYGFRTEITLPKGITVSDFKDCMEGLEQAINAHVKFKQLYGAVCELKIGTQPFHDKLIYEYKEGPSPLAVPLHTPFGLRWLDFDDETNCHLLCGGATRMGKSVWLRLITAHIMKATGGKCRIYLLNNKVTDLYMFRNIPQIKIGETEEEAFYHLDTALKTAHNRKKMLKEKGDVIDARQFRQKYPKEGMDPVFIIIDEYGRFADNEDIQKAVIEIAETAGYLDFHLVISAQRPDAKDVLKPRIKANILTRFCLTTSDETNSKIVLDAPDAAKLGGIKGRAILLDGVKELVQVPYLSDKATIEMMKEFVVHDGKRQEADPVSEALPSFVPRPVGESDLPGSSPTPRNRKSNRKAPRT